MPKNNRVHRVRPVHIRTLSVQSVTDLTPGMRRIVLAGESINGYSIGELDIPGVISEGFDDDVRLIFPDPSTGELPEIQLDESGCPLWQPPLTDLFRTYTVRAFDATAGTMTIDFARHTAGLAENWSKTAQPGDLLHVAGPKSSAPLPTHAEWIMFAGDDTALPAIARALEELPAGMSAVVIAQIKEKNHALELASAGEVTVHWVVDEDFGEACFTVDLPNEFSPETGYLWAAGEANALRKVRAFAKEYCFAKENTEFVGYWRASTGLTAASSTAETHNRNETASSANAEGDTNAASATTTGESSLDIFHRQAAMLDITHGIVVREAMALGLFEALTRRPLGIEALAQATGTLPQDLQRLLLFLESIGMLTRIPGATDTPNKSDDRAEHGTPTAPLWDLTSLSTDLSDPDSYFGLSLLGPAWEQRLSLLRLGDTLRARAKSTAQSTHTTVPAAVNPAEAFELRAQWWIPQLADHLRKVASSARIAVHAEYPEAVIEALAEAGLKTTPYNTSTTGTADAANATDAAGTAGMTEAAHHQVLVDPLSTHSTSQFRQLLTKAKRDGAAQVHIVSVLLDTNEPHDHDLVEDLSRMVRLDSQLPTLESLTDAARSAGWSIRNQPTLLNWDTALISLNPL